MCELGKENKTTLPASETNKFIAFYIYRGLVNRLYLDVIHPCYDGQAEDTNVSLRSTNLLRKKSVSRKSNLL